MTREENVKANLLRNIEFIKSRNNIETQKQFAEKTGISTPLMSKLKKDSAIPAIFPFFDRIRTVFGYTVDDMLYHDLGQEEQHRLIESSLAPETACTRCIGLYELFHFRTDVAKGMETGLNGTALRAGNLLIFRNPDAATRLSAIAVFNESKEEADALYQKISDVIHESGMEAAVLFLGELQEQHLYYGDVELTVHQIYISLKFEHRDRAFMIFHYAEGTGESYIGGLGCLVSTSRGRYCKPCMQYIGTSRFFLERSKDEIASQLVLSYPKLPTYEYIDELMDNIRAMYTVPGEPEPGTIGLTLSEENKRVLISAQIEKILSDIVQKNLFRVMAVTPDEDSGWYHFIKSAGKKS